MQQDTEPSAPLIVRGLTKCYDRRTAVDALSFDAAPGEVLGVIGPNGAGKTTTFLSLTGLVRPNAGTIALGERTLGASRGHDIALIPETPDVYPLLTVWEHLVFVARLVRLAPGWMERADRLIARLGLDAERDTLGHALSKGLRQKTLIAATVLAGSPVLLLDEPMIGLDPAGQRELREIILELRAEGRVVLLSTHMLSIAELLCDRVLILQNGRAIAQGSVQELRALHGSSLEELFLEVTAST